ncbi:GPW/gp25 family protein [Terrarubrum flagellatum]|uniref:GPW/gp25 family protein n=1 Tax=Terrirubrum flagellatum TaxID=2895980 RepID=UPI003144F28B
MAGVDRETGRSLDGWDHVVQSLFVLFTTFFGELVMRRWFGTNVPAILGRNAGVSLLVRFFSAIITGIELFEPRFRVKKITVDSLTREGEMSFTIFGLYRPRALFGDFTVEGEQKVVFSSDGLSVRVTSG